MSASSDPEEKALELIHDDVVKERDRLRSARAAITSRLGPLPASAGIVIGLVAGLDHKVGRGYLIAAGVLFVLVVVLSIRSSRLPPYRLLRGERVLDERQARAARVGDAGSVASGNVVYIGSTVDRSQGRAGWLTEKIELDEQLYGPLRRPERVGLGTRLSRLVHPSRHVSDLQDGFDVELAALNTVQALFACIVLVLLVGVVTH